MNIIKADAGECTADFCARVLKTLEKQDCHACFAEHNGIKVIVYQKSYILDVLDKFTMQRTIDQNT